MTIVSRRDPREILEVEVVAWTNRDHRVDMVERRVLVAINSNIWFSAILFRIQNCSNPCAASGNSSRIGKPQQLKDCPGRGRRKRMPGNTLNLLAPVLTNVFYYRLGQFLCNRSMLISTWSICTYCNTCQSITSMSSTFGWINSKSRGR